MSLAAKMNIVNELTDLELAKKVFIVLSAVSIVWIPVSGILIYLEKPQAIKPGLHTQEHAVLKPEPEESYLMAFNGSALFGASSGASSPVLQASLTELIKDYRLKGVVLAAESEAIVEDARTQKTIFVKAGEALGDLTVKEIGEGYAVFSYLGQETKLEIQ